VTDWCVCPTVLLTKVRAEGRCLTN